MGQPSVTTLQTMQTTVIFPLTMGGQGSVSRELFIMTTVTTMMSAAMTMWREKPIMGTLPIMKILETMDLSMMLEDLTIIKRNCYYFCFIVNS